ncbi:2'-5' RNA ligase [Flammeovirga sp. SJP92]|nr:2'-5' RNA ligase [Flammeovirga sp. SJP92]
MMAFSKKYNRSLHAHSSKGTTSDDRFMPKGYVQAFASLRQLVLTEKLDGQNNCLSELGVFARSHATPSQLPWDKPLIERWQLIKNQLKGLEVFGENMYGVHSIGYKKLSSFFYVFGIREKDQWLSWDEVKFYAEVLDFPTVPEIEINKPLPAFTSTYKNDEEALQAWITDQLGCSWENYVDTAGQLGGYDVHSLQPCCEGFVIRNADSFPANSGLLDVANNEFSDLFKLVRENHVKTDQHWVKNWQPATLQDYQTYQWHAYEYYK